MEGAHRALVSMSCYSRIDAKSDEWHPLYAARLWRGLCTSNEASRSLEPQDCEVAVIGRWLGEPPYSVLRNMSVLHV
jgi:hypothetical protein